MGIHAEWLRYWRKFSLADNSLDAENNLLNFTATVFWDGAQFPASMNPCCSWYTSVFDAIDLVVLCQFSSKCILWCSPLKNYAADFHADFLCFERWSIYQVAQLDHFELVLYHFLCSCIMFTHWRRQNYSVHP